MEPTTRTHIQQISVFIENRPGRVSEVCDLLEEQGINVRGFMISDTNDYGILRLVVDRPDEALALLNDRGYAAKAKPILVARLEDRPGNLSRLLDHLSQAGINVTYSYSLISTFVAICTSDVDEALQPALDAGVDLVTLDDIAPRLG